MTRANVFSLNWEQSKRYRHGLKWYAANDFPILCPIGQIPSFQLPISSADPITAFKIININSGDERDLLNELQGLGLVIRERDEGYQIEYNSVFAIAGFESSYYELQIERGDEIWYSEIVQFVNVWELENMIRVEFSNNEKLCYDGGAIYYDNGYRNWIYICADIAKPIRQYQERVKEVQGRIMPLQQITWKEFRFSTQFPEFLVDAFAIIPLHDFITIQNEARAFNVSRFLVSDEWDDLADVSVVDVEFRTDTVISNNGRAIDPQIENCCIPPNYIAEFVITRDSPSFVAGLQIPNRFAIVDEFNDGRIHRLYKSIAGLAWELVPVSTGQFVVIGEGVNKDYWFGYGALLQQPRIISFDEIAVDSYEVTARTFPNTYNRLVIQRTDSSEVVVNSALLSNQNGLIEYSFDLENVLSISVQPFTLIDGCNNFQPSPFFQKELTGGISVMEINSTFEVCPALPPEIAPPLSPLTP